VSIIQYVAARVGLESPEIDTVQELDEKRPSTIVVDGNKYQKNNNVHGASFEYSTMHAGFKISFLFSRDQGHYIRRIYAKNGKYSAGPITLYNISVELSSAFDITERILDQFKYEFSVADDRLD
jgi:hypothetical protein